MSIPYNVSCFWKQSSRQINTARINHFNSLGLDIKDKCILETGCGGCGDFTINLLNHTKNITLNDTRQDNINFIKQRIQKDLKSNNWDLNNPLNTEEQFDVIFSYGTIYHLHYPDQAIKNLSEKCKDFLIISMQTNGADNGMYLCDEQGFDQATEGKGCRCGRNWVKNELKKHFKYVYIPVSQPNHPDFPSNWEQHRQPLPGTVRFVIIGSHKELNNPNLTTELPVFYK